MEYQSSFEVREYLRHFDEILYKMKDKMLSFNMTSNITINFMECMIPHHEAAVCMCENLLTYTNYKPLYEMSKSIIKMQTQEISQMKDMLKTTKTCSNMPNHVNYYESKYLIITKNMIDKMKNSARIQNINIDFTSEMIPHHEGAIEMCNNLLMYPIDQRLVILANEIIKKQKEEIIKLKKIQEDLYK